MHPKHDSPRSSSSGVIDDSVRRRISNNLDLILNDLSGFKSVAVESLANELSEAASLIRSPGLTPPLTIEMVYDLATCVGVVFLRCQNLGISSMEIAGLHEELMNAARLQGERELDLSVDDVTLQLKYGNDQEFRFALLVLIELIREKRVRNEWVDEEGIIQILLNRLRTSKHNERSTIIVILRSLACESVEYKEKMTALGSLSVLVRSLTRDVGERREAVGLLVELLEIPVVRRCIGRIQGCVLMLVSMLNGDDALASQDAGKVLCALSSNTQAVLHMAETGYFKPLVQQLKEGSDMNKILMATALSKMELTDQSREVLGEDGALEPLIKMITLGKLEAKLSALGALQNLSSLTTNVQRLVNLGIVEPLLQLLFSVTSVLMTLQEPASAILASIAKSEGFIVNQNMAKHMLALLNLSSPIVQYHLLCALDSITSRPNASKVRSKMKEIDAVQLLLPFLTDSKTKVRTVAINLLYNLSIDLSGDLMEQLGETYLNILVNTISASTCEDEKAAAIAVLNNLPVTDKKATEILKRAHLLPILVSILGSASMTSSPTRNWLIESIAGVLVRFTVPWDKKLQLYSAEHGLVSQLVKLLSTGSPTVISRAATALSQLSQNSSSLSKSRPSRWLCATPVNAICEVHNGHCSIRGSFCLVKAGAISPLVQILEGKDRDADEAVLAALATLLQDEICEDGSNIIAEASGVQAIIRVLEVGNLKVQEKALWILERIFRVEAHRTQYGAPAQVLLIDLAQKGDATLKSKTAKILAQLELLQMQSSYF